MTTTTPQTARPDKYFRLPESIRPQRYDARLDVYVEERRFEGDIEIALELGEGSGDMLRLHCDRLEVSTVELDGKPARGWELEAESETLRIELDGEVSPGPRTLRISYSGKFASGDMFGLYWAGNMAATQFESAFARRVFPCFDEPAFKAPWKLTLSAEQQYTMLSNGIPEDERLDEATGRRMISFSETRPLASYLIAFGIGEIKGSEPLQLGETTVRTWGSGDQAKFSEFAQQIGHYSLEQEAAYFDVPYQFGKLDQLAVRDFQFGAMENAGLVIYNEADLLIDVANTPLSGRKRVAEVIAHENAHQWFGNYVTMQWWDDLWLNESFATWMALKIMDDWKPEWKIWEEVELFRREALAIDALDCTHPIRAEMRSVQESDERYRQITYYKGGAVLYMLEAFLTEEKFRDGMRVYMRQHRDGNATARDLWDALGHASGQPVREIAEDWINRPGYPLVEVSLEGKQLKLRQVRFNLHRRSEERPWSIPMVVRFIDDRGERFQRFLFSEREATQTLEAEGEVQLLCANAAASGFYRVAYADELNAKLMQRLDGLKPVERIAYLNDLWALALSGERSVTPFLEAVAGLGDESEESVLGAAAGGLSYLNSKVLDDASRESLRKFVVDLFGPAFQQIGWDPAPEEDEPPRVRRAELLRLVGLVGRSPEMVEEAGRRLDELLGDQKGSTDTNLYDAVTIMAARAGDDDRFGVLVKASQDAPDPQGRRRFRNALAAFEDPELQKQALAMTLTDAVPGPDLFRFFSIALGNPRTRDAAWKFYSANWPSLSERTGGATMLGYLIEFVQPVGPDYADEVTSFFKANPSEKGARAVEQTLEVLQVDKAFKAKAASEVSAWFAGRTG
ncbi:MAG: M1 family metallopeptidase [Dehalococcoidia bacterium]